MITIPESVWCEMLRIFAARKRGVEQVCYLDGVLLEDGARREGVVTTLVYPDADLFEGYFTVSSESMSAAGKHLRRFGLRRLAQVHTHPGSWTGHSPCDDEKAYSQAPGALSIVLPCYGREETDLEHAGVHVKTRHSWDLLTSADASQIVRVIPAFLDLRKPPQQDHERQSIITPRSRRWWHFFAFWKH